MAHPEEKTRAGAIPPVGASPPVGPVAPKLYYGWIIVAVAALLQFAGGTETFPVLGLFLKPMTDQFNWSTSMFTLPMTIGTVLGGIAAVFIGPAMDRYGGRWIMGISAMVLGAAFILLGFVQELWQYFVLQIIARCFTTGAFFMVASIIIPKWFVAKRGRASAFAGLGGRAGHIVLPIMTFSILSAWDWRAAWVALGVMVWVLAVAPIILFLKRTPEDMGLLPDGLTPADVQNASAPAANAKDGKVKIATEVSMGRREVLRHSSFYCILLAQCLMSFTVSGVHFHWFSYLTGRGIPADLVVTTVVVSNIVSIPISLAAGYLAERIHVRYILALTHVGLALTFVLMAFAGNIFMAFAFAICLGMSSGVTFTLNNIVFADYYGRASLGAVRGMAAPISMMTNAMGPLLASVAFDVLGDYTFIIWVYVTLAVAAAILWMVATPPKPKQPAETAAQLAAV